MLYPKMLYPSVLKHSAALEGPATHKEIAQLARKEWAAQDYAELSAVTLSAGAAA